MSTVATSAASATSIETHPRPWWLTLIEGSILVVIGMVMLWSPAKTQIRTWQLIVELLGIYWLIRGILDIVSMFTDHTAWGWKLFIGIVSIIAGGYILMYPAASALVLPQVFSLALGIWALVEGIIMLAMAFRGGGWGVGILGGVGILLGLVLIGSYGDFGMGLAFLWTAAVFALVGGIVLIIQSFRARAEQT